MKTKTINQSKYVSKEMERSSGEIFRSLDGSDDETMKELEDLYTNVAQALAFVRYHRPISLKDWR